MKNYLGTTVTPWFVLSAALASAQERVASAPTAFVEVVKAATPATFDIRLTSEQPAHVIETRRVALEAGEQRLRFDWTRERIEEASLRFDVRGPARLLAREKVKRLGNTVYLVVGADAAGEATLESRYLLQGIGWRVDYVLEVRRDASGAETALLIESVEFENHSGRDLEKVRVAFDGGAIESLSLEEGAKRRVELRRVAAVPLTRRYVFDPGRFGGSPGVELELANVAANGLGQALLPAGKIRVLQWIEGESAPRFVGEDVLPATPVGEKAKFSPGNARDITVERNLLFQGNENERRDRWNKVVVYDQKTRFRYKVKNGAGQPKTLKLVENPGAPFEITTPLDGLGKATSDRLERTLTLDTGATVEFEIEWVRRNLF